MTADNDGVIRGPAAAAFWDKLLGPFYTKDGARHVARLSRSEFETQVNANDILVVQFGDSSGLSPTFQFGRDSSLLRGLRPVLTELLRSVNDGWTAGQWMTAKAEIFGGHSAVDLLRDGEGEPVVAAAREDSDRWLQ